MDDTDSTVECLEVKIKGNDAKHKDERIVCEVCGHSNPADNALCEMCSNYLFKQRSVKN